MNEIQIYIIGKGYLDLLEQTNFPLVINKSIANISDISARDSTFSYDFEIPNNTNNNKILFGAEYVNATDKAILGKQDAVILLNGAEYERGFVEVKISKYLDKYVCNFFGGNAEWVELGNELLVKDLGFSPDITTYNLATINTQNGGNATNKDYAFPIVDRNTLPTDLLNSRPVFYVKSIFERFFGHENIGYTIESDFLNSKFVLGESDSNNKGLAVDLGCNYEFEDSVIENTFAEVRSDRPFDTSNVWYIGSKFPDNTGTPFFNTIDLTNFFNIEVSDEFNLWVTGTGYTAPKQGNYIISIDFRGSSWRAESPEFFGLWNALNNNTPSESYRTRIPRINLEVYRNGILQKVLAVNSLSRLNGVLVTFSQFCDVSDVLTFQIKTTRADVVTGVENNTLYSNYQWMPPPAFIRNQNVFTIQLKSNIEEGDQYQISSVIPKDMKAMELISDLKLLFNLYFDADIKTKVVKIEPRNDWKDADFEDVNGYYQSVGLATNWTNLIDLNFAPEIHTELPYNRTLIYRYKKDSDDKWLEQWERNNNRTYAEYRTDLNKPDPLGAELKRFPNGETVFETTLLAPTIQGESGNSQTVTSIIRAEYSPLNGIDAEQPTPNNRYAPRIGWFANDVFLMEAFNGVAPFESTATKLTFNGTSGLIDKFWSKTLSNLINAVTLKVNVNLNKIALRSFDFSKPVYIDAPQQIKGYYVVMSLEANLMNDSLVSAELLYYKDYAPITIDPSQATNINPNKQQQQIAPPNYVLYETETGQLINVLDEDDNGNLLTLLYD
jgi:hypothetical protein